MSFEYQKGMEVKEVIKCEKGKYGNRFSCGLSRAEENDKNIFINKKGEKVLDCSQYKRVGDFDENLAYVINDDDKLGFIDLKGNVVIDCKFGDNWYTAGYNSFSCGRALVHKDKELCFIDTSGNVVIKNFEKASPFYQDLAPVEINGKKCFINKAGEIAIDCSKYDSVGYFSDGLAGVRIGRKYGFIDKTGKEVLPLDYDIEEGFGFIDEFEDGLAIVCKNGKYGLIDTNGNEIAECKYKRVGNGIGDVDTLELDGKKYFINRKKKELVECGNINVGSFREGIALAHNGRGYGYIDIEGNAVVPFGKYRKAFSFSEGMGLVVNENGWGYVSYLAL